MARVNYEECDGCGLRVEGSEIEKAEIRWGKFYSHQNIYGTPPWTTYDLCPKCSEWVNMKISELRTLSRCSK